MGYPDEDAEGRIARRHQAAAEPLDDVPTLIKADEVLDLRTAARTVHVSEDVERYAVALVRATREHSDVRLGASPRSSVALYRVGQSWALLAGRTFVLPDDVRTVAHAVLAHRLLLEVDRELRGATVAGVVQEVIDSVPVPLADEVPLADGPPTE
jgi:MoxR-like ATPase